MPNAKKKDLRYTFIDVVNCNMCGSSTANQKILGKRLNGSQGRNPQKKTGITTTIAQCANCGLIYSNPQPVPSDIQDHYGIPPEEYWKKEYFELHPSYFKTELNIIRSLTELKKETKVLEVGAGIGKGMIACANAGIDVYGFESSIPFHERAISQMKIDPARLKLASMETVEYEENEFDMVFFMAVLEHLIDPSESIKKSLKWVKKGGLIYIEVPSSNWLIAKIINLYYKITRGDYTGNLSPMHEPYHLFEFSVKSFEENAKKLDYEIAFHQFYVCDTLMPKAIDYFIKPFMDWTKMGMQLVVVLRKK